MKVLRSLERARGRLRRSVITIGNFDGVPRGPQVILQRLRCEATKRGASAVVLTFEPHPVSVVRPDAAPLAIMTLPDRLRAIAVERADLTIVQHFSRKFAAIDADDFVRRFLVEILDAQLILVG